MRTSMYISGPMLLLLHGACSGSVEDSAAIGESETAEPDTNPDTGDEPEPYSDCETLHWRMEPDLLLTNQEEVDAFCFEWNAIDGNLTIDLDGDPDSPIWELDGISCLCEVTGDVEIFWIPDYNPDDGAPPPPHSSTDLELGLLERVGGDLLVRDIWGLAQFSFMSALTDVGGDFTLYGLDNLMGISLAGLQRVGGSFRVSDAMMLQAIELEALTELGGLDVRSQGWGELASLRKLTLPAVQTINGDVSLVGLSGLYAVEAESLQRIEGALNVEGACSYTPTFTALDEVASFFLTGNCGLEDFNGFPIERISGQSEDGVSLQIQHNDGLTQEAIDAFVASIALSDPGSVTAMAADDGACALHQSNTWKTDELWCKQ